MTESPSQTEIDAVAHFVEAARELRASPFFIEEFMSLGISMREGEPIENIKGRFPDPNILKAVLVPFRRIWHQNEPCHHPKVVNLLKRYMPDYRGLLDSFRFQDQRSVARKMPWFKDVDLSPSDVIDLWLNTRYHHVGKSSRVGRFTREDFERYQAEIGPVVLEYYFLIAVHEVGISMFNIQQCAEVFLRNCADDNLVPSFELDCHPGEANIKRTTPGVSLLEDTAEKRIWRLAHRRHYAGFNHFLSLTGLSDEMVAGCVNESRTFGDFLVTSDIFFEESDAASDGTCEGCTHFAACGDNHPTAVRNRRCRTGFMAKHDDGRLFWSGECKSVLEDQYLEFRKAFLRVPFE